MPAAVPRSTTLNRIPSLDGLRAISILLVVSLHSLQRYSESHPVSNVWFALLHGSTGVQIFFEISGFLITSLLLREHERRGSISLRGFYLRRAFRILPPLYLYIGVVMLLGLAGKLVVARVDVVGSAFFFHNIINGPTWSLEHLWSISVEEQFYLVWPFLLVLALAGKGFNGRMRAAIFPALVVLLSPPARILMRRYGGPSVQFASVHFLNFDYIMFGCLVAVLQHTPRFETVYRWVTRFWWVPPFIMLVCNALSTVYENYFDLTVGYTIDGFAVAMFLLWTTRNPSTVVGRALNSRPMVQIGVLSYSIYLWQDLFLHDGNERVFAGVPWLGRFPANWLGFLLAGAASYYVVEQPALRLRDVLIRQLRLYRAGRSTEAVS